MRCRPARKCRTCLPRRTSSGARSGEKARRKQGLTPFSARHNVTAVTQREEPMHIDRRAFLATLGSAAVIEAMSSEARADALEHYMIAQLDKPATPAAAPSDIRRGTGALFGGPSPSGQRPPIAQLAPLPEQPTLVDFIRFRGTSTIGNHILQSANDALKKGASEEVVLAC